MSPRGIGALVIAGVMLVTASASTAAECRNVASPLHASTNRIEADAVRRVRKLQPSFFGFNLEWLEFQGGIWDASTQRVPPSVIALFKEFPGAVYRFPGGANSNHLDWHDAVGPVDGRPERKQVAWMNPVRALFGPDEYLRFVKAVDGQAWYVANLYGSLSKEDAAPKLADDAGQLASHLKSREGEGLPPILRWELGNELDRPPYMWSPDKLAESAVLVADAISRNAPAAKFVHLQQEYAAQATSGYSARQYNAALRKLLAHLKPEYAMHFYYDGPPDTPPVSYFLEQLCQVIDSAKREGSPGSVWVTEHGRVPSGFWAKTSKDLWPMTANLEAAVSVADMLLALVQIPEVQGAFTHSLVADSSPWPLVHRRKNKQLDPSVTLLSMLVLRKSVQTNVLPTAQYSAGKGPSASNYRVRGAVLADDAQQNVTLWAINRSPAPERLEFLIKNAKGAYRFLSSEGISDEQSVANNYLSGSRVTLTRNHVNVSNKSDNAWAVDLPPNSVSALRFVSVR